MAFLHEDNATFAMRYSAFAKLAPPLFQSSINIRTHPETLALLCRRAVHEDWKLVGGRDGKKTFGRNYRQRRIRWRRLSGQWMSSGSDWSRRVPTVGGYGLKFKRLALQSFQGLLLSAEQGLAQRKWPSRIHRKKRQGRPPGICRPGKPTAANRRSGRKLSIFGPNPT